MRAPLLLMVLLAGAAGCDTSKDEQKGEATDMGTPVDSGEPGDGWFRLVAQEWTLSAGEENFFGGGFQPPRDYVVSAIRAIAPPGTHHVILYAPGGINDLFVSVPGTGEFHFPEGIGLRLSTGEMLSFQIHALDATPLPLSGTSGFEIKESDDPPDGGTKEANILNAAIVWLSLPPHQITTLSGQCTLTQDQTLFAIGPHMHELGTYMTATLNQGGVATTLHDAPFDWNAQRYYLLTPELSAHAGDVVTFACTWNNTTDATVVWGGLTKNEMCNAQIYRYPAGSSDFCAN